MSRSAHQGGINLLTFGYRKCSLNAAEKGKTWVLTPRKMDSSHKENFHEAKHCQPQESLHSRSRHLARILRSCLWKWPVATASSKPPKAHGGTLEISTAADVGGVTLEPGKYEVKQVNSPAGPVIRFTSVTLNPFAEYAEESLPPYWWEVVAKGKVTMQPLASKAPRTELRLASDGRTAVALQIRGNGVDYVF